MFSDPLNPPRNSHLCILVVFFPYFHPNYLADRLAGFCTWTYGQSYTCVIQIITMVAPKECWWASHQWFSPGWGEWKMLPAEFGVWSAVCFSSSRISGWGMLSFDCCAYNKGIPLMLHCNDPAISFALLCSRYPISTLRSVPTLTSFSRLSGKHAGPSRKKDGWLRLCWQCCHCSPVWYRACDAMLTQSWLHI